MQDLTNGRILLSSPAQLRHVDPARRVRGACDTCSLSSQEIRGRRSDTRRAGLLTEP